MVRRPLGQRRGYDFAPGAASGGPPVAGSGPRLACRPEIADNTRSGTGQWWRLSQADGEAGAPFSLVRRGTLSPLPALWIDIGQQDGWYSRAAELHTVLLDHGWPHTWQPAPGNHDDAYWARRMPDYLAFYGAALASAR